MSCLSTLSRRNKLRGLLRRNKLRCNKPPWRPRTGRGVPHPRWQRRRRLGPALAGPRCIRPDPTPLSRPDRDRLGPRLLAGAPCGRRAHTRLLTAGPHLHDRRRASNRPAPLLPAGRAARGQRRCAAQHGPPLPSRSLPSPRRTGPFKALARAAPDLNTPSTRRARAEFNDDRPTCAQPAARSGLRGRPVVVRRHRPPGRRCARRQYLLWTRRRPAISAGSLAQPHGADAALVAA